MTLEVALTISLFCPRFFFGCGFVNVCVRGSLSEGSRGRSASTTSFLSSSGSSNPAHAHAWHYWVNDIEWCSSIIMIFKILSHTANLCTQWTSITRLIPIHWIWEWVRKCKNLGIDHGSWTNNLASLTNLWCLVDRYAYWLLQLLLSSACVRDAS